MSKPLCIDLFCGLGGWTEGFLAEGYDCVGFDIERHDYGTGGYPADLVLQDVRTIHGSQFRDAAIIVASPPCQAYSYMAMPWSRAKKMAAEIREDYLRYSDLNYLFFECFRIQMEANEAAGRYIPMIVENVVGAQAWVGRAKWHYGSFYLWGDVPALMPMTFGRKVSGVNFHAYENGLGSSPSFNGAPHEMRHVKTIGHANMRDGLKLRDQDGYERNHESAMGWKAPRTSSHSSARKAASAAIAKIPLALSRHIAKVYKPRTVSHV